MSELGDVITLVMTREMLLGIKRRAEESCEWDHDTPPSMIGVHSE